MARPLTVTPPVDARPTTPTAPTTPGTPTGPAPAGLVARVWARPLWNHVAALAVVLVALVPVLGTGASFSADEGAAIVQARHLSRGGGWIVDHPIPEADPSGTAYPLELSAQGSEGTAPFAKHPLYALMLAGADRLGGSTGMVLLSVAGTLIAAALGAALGSRLRPGLARSSLWAVGLASPLLFDGYLVIAHTLGAAFAAGAVVCALRGIEGRGRSAVAVTGVAVCVAGATLLRNEALFWAIALGVVTGVVALRRRSLIVAAIAVASVTAAGVSHLGEQVWETSIVGGPGGTGAAAAINSPVQVGAGFVSERLDSFALTWLRPTYGGVPRLTVLLVLMVAAIAVAAVAVRRRPGDHGVVVVLGATAAVSAVTAVALYPTNVVPGLLVACPVLVAGLATLGRSTVASVAARVSLGTFALFALAVAATQYSTGGSGEWGGRYFAIGLPVLVPVLLLALAQAGDRAGRSTRQAAVAALVACSMAMTVMGMASLRGAHRFTGRLMASAEEMGQATGSTRPVMVTTRGLVPRMAWATFDRQRWLLTTPQDLQSLLGRVGATGVERVVVMSDDLGNDLQRIGDVAQVEKRQGSADGQGWQIVLLRLRS